MAHVLVSDDLEGSKLFPQGTILCLSLMPSSSDTLRRNFTKFGTGIQCNKGFQNMYILGQKFRGAKILNSRKMSFSTFFGRIVKKERKNKKIKNQKTKSLTPYFVSPKLYIVG